MMIIKGIKGLGAMEILLCEGGETNDFFLVCHKRVFFDNLYITLKKLFYEMGFKQKLIDFI